MSKFAESIRNSFLALKAGVKAKQVWAISIVVAMVSFLLISGAGVTAAVTGVFTPQQEKTLEEDTSATSDLSEDAGEGKESGEEAPAQSGSEPPEMTLDPQRGIGDEVQRGLRASGWVGIKAYFGPQFMGVVVGFRPAQLNDYITITYSVNGVQSGQSRAACARDTSGTCVMYMATGAVLSYSPNINDGLCRPGGDFYTVSVSGTGATYTDSGRIPAGIINCPAPAAPSPPAVTPTPTTPAVPEPSPSPSIPEPSPEATPTEEPPSEPAVEG